MNKYKLNNKTIFFAKNIHDAISKAKTMTDEEDFKITLVKPPGGKRPGSGRKSLFKEKTKGVKFMCPISKEPDLKKHVNRKLLEWSKSGI